MPSRKKMEVSIFLDANQLENKKLDELRNIAKEMGIKNITKYKKKSSSKKF